MFKLSYSKSAIKNLIKIPKNKRDVIVQKIENLKQNPYAGNNNIKKLINIEGYRLRVGDYRVVYKIENEEYMILIIEINARGQIYK